jgi:hypothetical protein
MEHVPLERTKVKVQIRDPDTDELLEEKIVDNDYIVVCAGNRYIKSMQVWGETHQLNIARKK